MLMDFSKIMNKKLSHIISRVGMGAIVAALAQLVVTPWALAQQSFSEVPPFLGGLLGTTFFGFDRADFANYVIVWARVVGTLFAFAGSLALLMVAVGGIRYMLAQGDEGASEEAKKTIANALFGLGVVVTFIPIIGTVVYVITGDRNVILAFGGSALGGLQLFDFLLPEVPRQIVQPTLAEVIVNVIPNVLAIVGAFAVVGVIIGGAWYLSSAGDEDRAETGKRTIWYSIMGLVIIILSYAIVRTVQTVFFGK